MFYYGGVPFKVCLNNLYMYKVFLFPSQLFFVTNLGFTLTLTFKELNGLLLLFPSLLLQDDRGWGLTPCKNLDLGRSENVLLSNCYVHKILISNIRKKGIDRVGGCIGEKFNRFNFSVTVLVLKRRFSILWNKIIVNKGNTVFV